MRPVKTNHPAFGHGEVDGSVASLVVVEVCSFLLFSRRLCSSLYRSDRPTFRGLAEDSPMHDASEHGGASRPAFRGEWLPRLGWEDHSHLISGY